MVGLGEMSESKCLSEGITMSFVPFENILVHEPVSHIAQTFYKNVKPLLAFSTMSHLGTLRKLTWIPPESFVSSNNL